MSCPKIVALPPSWMSSVESRRTSVDLPEPFWPRMATHSPRAIWVDQKTGESVLPEQLDLATAPEGHHDEDLSSMLAAVWPEDQIVPAKVSDIHLAAAADAHAGHGEANGEHHAGGATTAEGS